MLLFLCPSRYWQCPRFYDRDKSENVRGYHYTNRERYIINLDCVNIIPKEYEKMGYKTIGNHALFQLPTIPVHNLQNEGVSKTHITCFYTTVEYAIARSRKLGGQWPCDFTVYGSEYTIYYILFVLSRGHWPPSSRERGINPPQWGDVCTIWEQYYTNMLIGNATHTTRLTSKKRFK